MDQTKSLHTQGVETIQRDPGSFRDPSGFVCHHRGEVYRAVDGRCASVVDRLSETGLLGKLERMGTIVPTRILDPGELQFRQLLTQLPRVEHFLHHRRIPLISYPYEWTPTMLADAALCSLDLQLMLVEHGYSLKDASAYNIQFDRGKPIFIDIPSIETVARRDVWVAFDQFCRMFLFPLWLSIYKRCTLKEYFLANLDGADLDDVYDRFGSVRSLAPSMCMDLWLPHLLQRVSSAVAPTIRRRTDVERSDPRPLLINLRRLRRKIQRIASRAKPTGRWTKYETACPYDEEEITQKERFVSRVLLECECRSILDLGCNTGRFTKLAADRGLSVVAVDQDVSCVDALYRRGRDQPSRVMPLVVDIANPSPGTGFRNIERSSFLERCDFDCVMALALVHHLLVTSRIPLVAVRDLLFDLTHAYVIVEYIDPSDAMFLSLRGAREDLYHDLTLSVFKRTFLERFELVSEEKISSTRSLMALRRR